MFVFHTRWSSHPTGCDEMGKCVPQLGQVNMATYVARPRNSKQQCHLLAKMSQLKLDHWKPLISSINISKNEARKGMGAYTVPMKACLASKIWGNLKSTYLALCYSFSVLRCHAN